MTPEERAREFMASWMEWRLEDDLVVLIRAAENDALERATKVISALKHPEAE